MKEINIALIGLGNVGRGVVKILERNSGLIQDRTSYRINLEAIVVRNKLKVSEDYKKYKDILPSIEVLNSLNELYYFPGNYLCRTSIKIEEIKNE